MPSKEKTELYISNLRIKLRRGDERCKKMEKGFFYLDVMNDKSLGKANLG